MKLFLENPHLLEYFGLVAVLLLLFGATFFVEKLIPVRKWAGIGLILVPIIYFFLILDAHLVNIPYSDDFDLLETIDKFQKTPDFVGRIKILFTQVNQHRFAFERIVMLLMVFFTGTVNIKTQIILGDLFLLGIAYFLFQSLKKESVSWYYFIPVPYVIFNLVYFENAFWGIAALQNTPLIFFAFLTAYGIGRNDRKGLYIGIAAALLTTFTSGSGILAWIIGLVLLFFQKRYKVLLVWLIAAATVILFYFLFDYYIIPPGKERVWDHPFYNLIFAFGFFGNALFLDVRHPLIPHFQRDLIWCVLLGAGLASIFFVWFIRILVKMKTLWSDWFLWGAMMFVIGTGAMFVISRPISNYFMYGGNLFSRRYMLFGIVLLATGYVCAIILSKDFKYVKRFVAIAGIAGFVALNFVSYYLSIVQVRKLHDELVIDSYFWKNYKTFLSVGKKFSDIPFWNHPTRMSDLIKSLEKNGLSDFYQFHTLPDHQVLIQETSDPKSQVIVPFDARFQYRNSEDNIPTRYNHFQIDQKAGDPEPGYFVLTSPKITLVLPTVPIPNSPSQFIRGNGYYSNSYSYALYKEKLPTGTFDAWILYPDPVAVGKWRSFPTGKKVLLK